MEGAEDMEFCVGAPQNGACRCVAPFSRYGFGAIAKVRRRVFVPPIARYARIRGKLALRFRQGVLRLGASNVAMSYAMALFCKTHRQNPSASFPTGAAGGTKHAVSPALTHRGSKGAHGFTMAGVFRGGRSSNIFNSLIEDVAPSSSGSSRSAPSMKKRPLEVDLERALSWTLNVMSWGLAHFSSRDIVKEGSSR